MVACVLEYTPTLPVEIECLPSREKKIFQVMPGNLFFFLRHQHKLCCGGILLASTLHKQTRTHVSEGQLSLFLFSNYDSSLSCQNVCKFQIHFGSGGIFSSNLSGETSTLHNWRLQTSSVNAHYYWLVWLFIQSHFVSGQFLASKGDTALMWRRKIPWKKKKEDSKHRPLPLILVYFVHICAQLLDQIYCR